MTFFLRRLVKKFRHSPPIIFQLYYYISLTVLKNNMQKTMFIKEQIYDTVKRFCMACGDNSVKIKSLKEKI